MSNFDFTKDFLKSVSLLVGSVEKLLGLRRYGEENWCWCQCTSSVWKWCEHFVSHSQGTQGFLVQKKKWLLQLVPPGLVSCSISKWQRGVAAGEMPEPFTGFQMTLENLVWHYKGQKFIYYSHGNKTHQDGTVSGLRGNLLPFFL